MTGGCEVWPNGLGQGQRSFISWSRAEPGTTVGLPPLIPLLGLLALCLIWGLSVPLTKLGLQFFPPLLLAALRYLAAAPFFVLLLLWRALPSRRALLMMALLGMIGIDVGQVLQILGVQRTDASVATVISATIPIFVVLWPRGAFGNRSG